MSRIPFRLGLLAARQRLRHSINLYNMVGLFNPLFDFSTGGARRPTFFDAARVRPELHRLDGSWPVILDEFVALRAAISDLPPYHIIDSDVLRSSGRTDRDRYWRIFMLHCFGRETSLAQRTCPRTLDLIRSVPGLLQAFFSVLEPKKSIPAHVGPSRVYRRYHLGLNVPEEKPPTLRVHDCHYQWKTGESVVFDDSWDHEIVNDCPQPRIILILDFERPLPAIYAPVIALLRKAASTLYARRVMAAQEAVLGLVEVRQAEYG